MLAVLVAALPHHVHEQDVSLAGVDEIFDRRREHTK